MNEALQCVYTSNLLLCCKACFCWYSMEMMRIPLPIFKIMKLLINMLWTSVFFGPWAGACSAWLVINPLWKSQCETENVPLRWKSPVFVSSIQSVLSYQVFRWTDLNHAASFSHCGFTGIVFYTDTVKPTFPGFYASQIKHTVPVKPDEHPVIL